VQSRINRLLLLDSFRIGRADKTRAFTLWNESITPIKGRSAYIPTRFVSAERNASVDKLLLAFDASVFSQAYGVARPRVGKLIHGREHATTTVPLAPLYPKVNQFSPPPALSTPTLHRRHSC
jgi:hypothetical protein